MENPIRDSFPSDLGVITPINPSQLVEMCVFRNKLGGSFKKKYVHPEHRGNYPILTSILFKWVETQPPTSKPNCKSLGHWYTLFPRSFFFGSAVLHREKTLPEAVFFDEEMIALVESELET